MSDARTRQNLIRLADSVLAVTEVWTELGDPHTRPPYKRGCAAWTDETKQHRYTGWRERPLTDLVLSASQSMYHAIDQLRGVAVLVRAPGVALAMYPPVRTALVAVAHAHWIVSGDSTEERLRRHLNCALEGNASQRRFTPDDPRSTTLCDRMDTMLKEAGEKAGLIWRSPKNGVPYFASNLNQSRVDAAPSETQRSILLMSDIDSLDPTMKAFTYRRLSEVVHDRPFSAGFISMKPTGERIGEYRNAQATTTVDEIARNTLMAAFAVQLAGSRVLRHCGKDSNDFNRAIRSALEPWRQLAY